MIRRTRMILAVAATAAVLVAAPPGVAAAASPQTILDVSMICDAATRTIHLDAWATQGYAQHPRLNIVIEQTEGSWASDTRFGRLPVREPVTIPVTTRYGAWDVFAHPLAWTAPGDQFYWERLRIKVVDPVTGLRIHSREAECYHDQRTVAAFDCDPTDGTAHVHVSGTGYRGHTLLRVTYYRLGGRKQHEADGPVWEWHNLGPTSERAVYVSVAPDGSWSDPGVRHTGSTVPYYEYSDYLIVVSDLGNFASAYSGIPSGRATGVCVTSDHRAS